MEIIELKKYNNRGKKKEKGNPLLGSIAKCIRQEKTVN
jgi:hypothetical protein